ncbi:MAG: N-acetylneuraminate synthase family protein [Planctomycetota bacterium]
MKSPPSLKFGRRIVGPGRPVYVIAEAGVNHNGDVELARRLVWAAKDSGADAVKFQMFRAESLVSRRAPAADYQRDQGYADQLSMLRRLELKDGDFAELRDIAEEAEIDFLASAFDPGSLATLLRIRPAAIKFGSGELTDLLLLGRAARTRLPVILSTGMAELREVDAAVACLGRARVALLQCVSSYPCPAEEANVRGVPVLAERYGTVVGYSDHTAGAAAACAAVALGASIVEKHFTLDRRMKGPDHAASADPEAFTELVRSIRETEAVLGASGKSPTRGELRMRTFARKSLVAARRIAPGEKITPKMLVAKRPGTGIQPSDLARVLGRRARVEIAEDTPLRWEQLSARRG